MTTVCGRYSPTSASNSSARQESRSGNGTVGAVEITPPATAASDPFRRVTTPYPHRESPGSIPMTNTRSMLTVRLCPGGDTRRRRRTPQSSALVGRHHRVGDVEVGVDVLHVV